MLTIAEMTEQEQVLAYKIEDELVAARVMNEADAKTYAAICIERARAYAARITTMTIPLYLQTWAVEMAAAKGTARIKVHHNYLPWLAGFLVTRYGEAVEHWPDALTDKDLERARDWKRKGLPPVVVA
jgi:hypothetical protein